jgi:hypothetical protein
MRHLSEEELIDLAEGVRAEHQLPHLSGCQVCRARLTDLRGVLTAAAEIGVPEPSPLFWAHFSERVSDAVAAEASAPAVPRLSWRFLMPGFALAAVVLAAVLSLRPPSAVQPPAPFAGQPGESPVTAPDPVSLVNDPSLSLMADLAADLDLDDVAEAGLTTTSGALDRVVLEMSADERVELQRILKQAMSRQGA